MGGRGVEVIIGFLNVLAVIAFGTGQAEKPLLEDGVLAVPEREGEAEAGLVVADAKQAILTPALGTRAGVVVRDSVPGLTIA
jgi:hypothetical protein